MAREPGKKFEYSDLGIILLAEIIERIAGQPLDLFLKEQVFAPLGMKQTFYRPAKELLPRIPPTNHKMVAVRFAVP